MSGTKSPSPPGPATDPPAVLIVAHGSPSAFEPQEVAIRALAAQAGALLPGWSVRGATLAAHGALETAVRAIAGRRLVVYPLFMSDGWFASTELPRRLSAAGCNNFAIAPPLGLDPALHALCLAHALEGAAHEGLEPARTAVLLAAHGSPSDPRPRAAAQRAADVIAASGQVREVRVGLIDEPPYLADAARLDAPALCLPFFAARAGHVTNDIPQALVGAEFEGPLLEPVGLHRDIPQLIAASLRCFAGRVVA
jgi:sirohydrochlorin cobaltochelatase